MSVVPVREVRRAPAAQSEAAGHGAGAIALPALLLAAVVVRFAFIGTQGFWFDEAHTSALVRSSLSGMLQQLPGSEDTPPLYFIAAWIWGHIFGYGEVALRSLSALAGVGTIAVVHGLGKRLVSTRAGLTAAAIATFNPLLVWYSQEARSYSLLVLLVSLGLLAFVHLRQEITPRWLLIWSLSSSLALMTHYFAGLVVLPELFVLLAAGKLDWPVRRAVGLVVLVGLALVPLMIRQFQNMSGGGWIGNEPLLSRIGAVPVTFATGYASPVRPALFVLTALIVLGAIGSVFRLRSPQTRRGAADLGGLIGAGVLIVAILLALGYDELDQRNVIVLLIPVIMLIAIGLTSLRSRWLGLALTATVCVAGLIAIIGVDVDPAYQRPDWRPVARALGGARTQPRTAIFILNGCQGLPLALYMPQLEFPTGTPSVQRLDLIRVGRPISWDSACSTYRLNTPMPHALAGFRRAGGIQRIGRFSIERLRANHQVPLRYRTTHRARFLVAGLPGILLVNR